MIFAIEQSSCGTAIAAQASRRSKRERERNTVTHPLIRVLLLALPCLASAGPQGAGALAAPAAPAGQAAAPSPSPASESAKASAAAPTAPPLEANAHLKVPLFSEKFAQVPIATVDDETITLHKLADALAEMHQSQGQGAAAASARDFMPLLDRLIEIKLIVLEGRDMELDQLPDVKSAVASFREETLRAVLERKVTHDVDFDAAAVDQEYKDAVREWQVSSALLDSETDAKALVAKLRAGKSFAEESKQLFADKKAQGTVDHQWLNREKVVPELAAVLLKIREPAVNDPVLVKGGYAVVQVHEVRYPEDPARRADLERQSKAGKRVLALQEYFRGLVKKYAKVDQALLKRINFEAPKPGIAALAEDKRVLVRISGEKPITVADLTLRIAAGFFHGVDDAIKEKRVNSQKSDALRNIMTKALFLKEARRQGLENSEEYKSEVKDFEDRAVFQMFIEKVLGPDVRVTEDEGKAYYEEHKAEYKYPAFYKLEGLGFSDSKSAEGALAKIKAGTDLQWLRGNADGQLKPDVQKVQLDGHTLSATAMPAGLAQILAGSKAGDYRLYAAPDSQYYVIHVVEQTPENYQEYAAARSAIANVLIAQHLTNAIRDYAAKLRTVHDVRVFISRIDS